MPDFLFGLIVGVGLGSLFANVVLSLRFGVPFSITRHGRPIRPGK